MADLTVSSNAAIIAELKGREDWGGVIVEIDLAAPATRSAVIAHHVSDTIAGRGRRVAEVLMQAASQVESSGL